ncbi:MAG TPA: hypothetical protein EYP59_13670 [Thiotrichaceae bacterium]|nr:hypothetical protein [Thiotrichaceae bacterium]
MKLKNVASLKNKVRLLVMAGGLATSMAMATEIEELMVDTWLPSGTHGPVTVSTNNTLYSGAIYILDVRGTYTKWNNLGQNPCGRTESNAQYPSPNESRRTDTRVGIDAAENFAFPDGHRNCNKIPFTSALFQYSLDGGKTWGPLAPPVNNVPDSDHYYIYQLLGQGYHLQVRYSDSNYTDNYGQFRITLNRADKALR